jgi:hypothetical protein
MAYGQGYSQGEKDGKQNIENSNENEINLTEEKKSKK